MSGIRKWVAVYAVLTAAVAVTGFWINGRNDQPAGATTPPTSSVAQDQTVPVTRGDLTEIVTLKAQIAPLAQFSVNATASGVFTRQSLNAGAVVATGGNFGVSGGAAVTTPIGGTFVRWLVSDGTQVAAGLPVAVLTYPGFAETATVPADAAYRLMDGRMSARAEIICARTGCGPC